MDYPTPYGKQAVNDRRISDSVSKCGHMGFDRKFQGDFVIDRYPLRISFQILLPDLRAYHYRERSELLPLDRMGY